MAIQRSRAGAQVALTTFGIPLIEADVKLTYPTQDVEGGSFRRGASAVHTKNFHSWPAAKREPAAGSQRSAFSFCSASAPYLSVIVARPSWWRIFDFCELEARTTQAHRAQALSDVEGWVAACCGWPSGLRHIATALSTASTTNQWAKPATNWSWPASHGTAQAGISRTATEPTP